MFSSQVLSFSRLEKLHSWAGVEIVVFIHHTLFTAWSGGSGHCGRRRLKHQGPVGSGGGRGPPYLNEEPINSRCVRGRRGRGVISTVSCYGDISCVPDLILQLRWLYYTCGIISICLYTVNIASLCRCFSSYCSLP